MYFGGMLSTKDSKMTASCKYQAEEAVQQLICDLRSGGNLSQSLKFSDNGGIKQRVREDKDKVDLIQHHKKKVDVGMRPLTGLRLYLEGRRSNRLAIHLQHLSPLPRTFQLIPDPTGNFPRVSYDWKYYEPVQWKNCSHVCTAPVQSDKDLSIVTGAQFQLSGYCFKKILFSQLRFCTIVGAVPIKNPEWAGSPNLAQKSGVISMLMSGHFSTVHKPPPRPADVTINSAVYPGGLSMPASALKLLKFVDSTEMTRGPQITPGYWVVSGAKLFVEKGKISLQVKYSLLAAIPPDKFVE